MRTAWPRSTCRASGAIPRPTKRCAIPPIRASSMWRRSRMHSSSCLEAATVQTSGRLPGWEDRLAEAIAAARAKPYVLGEHDCFRLACAVVRALTGEDRWPQWRGRYASKREALRLIAEAGRDFTAAFSAF